MSNGHPRAGPLPLPPQKLHSLPSARLPTRWDPLLAALRPVAQCVALTAVCFAAHSLGRTASVLGGLVVGLAAAGWGWRRGSLDGSGAAAALVLGGATLAASFRGGLTLLAFFFASSKITQASGSARGVGCRGAKGPRGAAAPCRQAGRCMRHAPSQLPPRPRPCAAGGAPEGGG